MKKSTQSWLNLAQEDLIVLESIHNNELATGAASFHAQQCVEKSLKAVLEEYAPRVPKIHDLNKLFHEVSNFLSIEFDEITVEKLNSLYIESRYPGAFGFLPSGKPTLEDVSFFFKFAQNIFNSISEKLKP